MEPRLRVIAIYLTKNYSSADNLTILKTSGHGHTSLDLPLCYLIFTSKSEQHRIKDRYASFIEDILSIQMINIHTIRNNFLLV